jgi:hypothetical protein
VAVWEAKRLGRHAYAFPHDPLTLALVPPPVGDRTYTMLQMCGRCVFSHLRRTAMG